VNVALLNFTPKITRHQTQNGQVSILTARQNKFTIITLRVSFSPNQNTSKFFILNKKKIFFLCANGLFKEGQHI
jgi:hypothetical protein